MLMPMPAISGKAAAGKWSRVGMALGWILVALWFLQILTVASFGSRLSYTCVVCRAKRVDYTYFFLQWSRIQDTDSSRWYAANVETRHAHTWERHSCRAILSPLGTTVGFACRTDVSPIWSLPAESQLEFYRHYPSPKAAKALFVQFANPRFYDQAVPGSGETQGRLVARAIVEWQLAGFPGTWESWWPNYVASRVGLK